MFFDISNNKPKDKEIFNDLGKNMRINHEGNIYNTYAEIVCDNIILFRCIESNAKFNIDQDINIEFIKDEGVFCTNICIKDILEKNDKVYYKGKINSSVQKVQRRAFYRLSIDTEVIYRGNQRDSLLQKGNTLNISAGGMLLETDGYVGENKGIEVIFKINEKIYKVKSTIINKKVNTKTNRNHYHIRFDNLNNTERDEIAQYIFEKQKQELCKKCGWY